MTLYGGFDEENESYQESNMKLHRISPRQLIFFKC